MTRYKKGNILNEKRAIMYYDSASVDSPGNSGKSGGNRRDNR